MNLPTFEYKFGVIIMICCSNHPSVNIESLIYILFRFFLKIDVLFPTPIYPMYEHINKSSSISLVANTPRPAFAIDDYLIVRGKYFYSFRFSYTY